MIHSYEDQDAVKELLMGQTLTKVSDTQLRLSDGRLLKVKPNEGCGGCSAGWFEIDQLVGTDNIVTNVEFDVTSDPEAYDFQGTFKIFVFAGNERINLLSVSGYDNGYYGVGYWIDVQEEKTNA